MKIRNLGIQPTRKQPGRAARIQAESERKLAAQSISMAGSTKEESSPRYVFYTSVCFALKSIYPLRFMPKLSQSTFLHER